MRDHYYRKHYYDWYQYYGKYLWNFNNFDHEYVDRFINNQYLDNVYLYVNHQYYVNNANFYIYVYVDNQYYGH